MVEYSETRLDRVFHALADPTRRRVLVQLRTGTASVSEIADPLPMSMPAVAKHLRVLEDAGLVETSKKGRVRRCVFRPENLGAAEGFINEIRKHWDSTLDALTDYVEKLEQEKEE